MTSLRIITKSLKAVENISELDLKIVKKFILVDSSQSVDIRHIVYYLIKNFMIRMKRVLYSDYRQLQNYEKNKKYIRDQPSLEKELIILSNETQKRIDYKQDFLKWFYEVNVTSLFPGASFHRISSHLRFLSICAEVQNIDLDATTRPDLKVISGFILNPSSADLQIFLSSILHETHESTRISILDYISNISSPVSLQSVDEDFLVTILPKMIKSIRASELESGAYLARFIYLVIVKKGLLQANDGNGDDSSISLGYLEMLSQYLSESIELSRTNLAVASTEFPLNGILAAISQVLKSIDLKSVFLKSRNMTLYKLILSVCDRCHEVSQIVLEICTHSSPEGNIPASFEEMGSTVASLIKSSGTENDTLSQIILRHCFRALKESTDCLVTIVTSIPYESLSSNGELLNVIKRAGEFLRSLITLVRHRGALSAAYENFSILCKYIVSSDEESLQKLLDIWLLDYYKQMLSHEISVTRRSAGLPFAIQAILGANPYDRKRIDRTLNFLFDIIEMEVKRNEQHDLVQVHALNVTKALVQDSVLMVTMPRFYKKIFQVCLKQFQSPYFPIQNCACMLFCSITDRMLYSSIQDKSSITGASQADKSNLVTAYEFFKLYTNLHDILLIELRSSVNYLKHVIVIS